METKIVSISQEIVAVNEQCNKLDQQKQEIEMEQIKKMETIRNLTNKREGLIRD